MPEQFIPSMNDFCHGLLGHLDAYLDEFTFRFNRRSSASRGKLFYRLAQQAMLVEPAPFDTLTPKV